MTAPAPTFPFDWTAARRRAAPAVAVALLGAWGANLSLLLVGPEALGRSALALPLALAQTWLHTGLFIVAHDALHGTAAPGRGRLNRTLGAVALGLYALFPFDALRGAHDAHHAAPRTRDDPDGPGDEGEGFARWYVRFIGRYLRWTQVAGLALAYNVAHHALGVAEWRLLAFWVAPSLLSTIQLFAFGTWLPHRAPRGGFRDAHRATSVGYGTLASLLACFHFGYHWEHHASPSTPWWALPAARRARLRELVDAKDPVGAEDRDAADAP